MLDSWESVLHVCGQLASTAIQDVLERYYLELERSFVNLVLTNVTDLLPYDYRSRHSMIRD